MAKRKFLLVSLQEDQAKKLAQVLSNDTSRKIIDHLADKEDTEANISKILGLPISTVHYNLSLLVAGGLVEAGEFHYSTKGREVKHYKLANQYILIAPKSTFGLKERLKGFLPAVGLLGGISLAISWLTRPAQPVFERTVQSGAQEAGIMAMRTVPEAIPTASQMIAQDAVLMQAGPAADIAQVAPWDIALLIFVGGLLTLVLYLALEYLLYYYKEKH